MSRVQCPKCKAVLQATDKTYGRKVRCKCDAILRMPPAPVAASAPPTQSVPLPPIRFQCPSCQQGLQVKGEFAGKVSKCKCGAKMRIPSPVAVAVAPAPDPFADPFADPLGGQDPFANPGQNDFMSATSTGLDPLTGQAGGVSNSTPNHLTRSKKPVARKPVRKRSKQKPSGGGISIDREVIGGVLAMLGAVVWFVGGLFAGYIFFYPPILFVIGLASVVKGLLDGD